MNIHRFYFLSHDNFVYKCRARNEQDVRMLANRIRRTEKEATGANLGKLIIIKSDNRKPARKGGGKCLKTSKSSGIASVVPRCHRDA
jgi:hypothetical protein